MLGVYAENVFWSVSSSASEQQYLAFSGDSGTGAQGYWDSGEYFSEGGGSTDTVDEIGDINKEGDDDSNSGGEPGQR